MLNKASNNYLWILFGQGLKFFINTFYLLILVRILKVDEYGQLSSTLSVMYIFFPFVGVGIGNILVKEVSQGKAEFNKVWGGTLILILSSFFIVTPVTFLFFYVLNPDFNVILFFILSITELLFYSLIEASCQAFQAYNNGKNIAKINIFFSITRLSSVLIVYIIPGFNLNHWLIIYCVSSLLPTIYALVLVRKYIGKPQKIERRSILNYSREGIQFSLNVFINGIMNEFDKIILTRFQSDVVVGLYGFAYKVIDISFIPVKSFLYYSYSKFFRYGKDGLDNVLKFLQKTVWINILYSLIISGILYLLAPFLIVLVGDQYADSEPIIKLMCFIPFVKVLYYFTGDTLTGAGYQKIRTYIHLITAIITIFMNVILVKNYSWIGSVITMYCSYIVITLLQLLSIFIIIRIKKKDVHSRKIYVVGDSGE